MQYKLAGAWEQRKARDLFDSYADKGYPELPVLSATQDAGMVKRDEIGKSVFHDKSNEVGYKRVLPGQFVIHLRSFQGGFAHSNIEGITSPAYTIFGFKPTEKQYDIFWKYIFSSEEFVRRLEAVTYGIRDGRSISYDEFLTMGFIVPSYAEQVKIAHGLIITDNLITLHQCKRAAFFDWKSWPYSKFEESKNTLAWEQCKLGDIGKTYGGLSGKAKEDFGHGDARFVTYMNVFSNPVGDPAMTEAIELDSRQNEVKKGDIFFTTSSETPEEVGMSCVWMQNTPNTYLNSFCFGYRPIVELDLYYLAYVLCSNTVRHKFIFLAQGISRYNISKNKVMEMLIPVPNKGEQVLLGTFFKDLDNLITLHQRGKKYIGEIKNDKRNKTE